jgi:CDP-diglyceride synthetase
VTIFEMVFNLIGLVLGLSLVVVLSGLAKTVDARAARRIGWLTPLLGLWVILDLAAFWGLAFEVRDLVTNLWPSLLVGVILSSVYFLAAALVFPDDPRSHPDLDAHYWQNKRWVIGLVIACDFAAFFIAQLLGRHPSTPVILFNAVYLLVGVAAFVAKGYRVNVALLALLGALMAAGFLMP